MICPHAEECSGCSQWGTPYPQQLEHKRTHLTKLGRELGFAGEVQVHSLGPAELRDRADLQWRRGEGWGFLSKDFRKLKVIDQCLLFTEPLRELFQWWSQFKLQAQKASVRLRVDEQGHWGVWLDMANVDVRDLLQQDALLSEWVAKAHIEIGQRHKVLRKIATAWKLADPELRSWFHTVDGNGNKFNLYGSVGSFTQVGRAVNAILVQRSLELLGPASERTILELGAGSGNFTLAFAAEGFRVKAFEQSAGALEALKKSLQEYPPLATRVECHAGNFQKVNWGEMSKEDTILFLDPPRSGVGANLLEQVRAGHFSTIVYVACGVEAWVSDGHLLKASGYQLEKLEWVDQFPNTPLYEILSAWSLKPS